MLTVHSFLRADYDKSFREMLTPKERQFNADEAQKARIASTSRRQEQERINSFLTFANRLLTQGVTNQETRNALAEREAAYREAAYREELKRLMDERPASALQRREDTSGSSPPQSRERLRSTVTSFFQFFNFVIQRFHPPAFIRIARYSVLYATDEAHRLPAFLG